MISTLSPQVDSTVSKRNLRPGESADHVCSFTESMTFYAGVLLEHSISIPSESFVYRTTKVQRRIRGSLSQISCLWQCSL